MKKLIVLFTVLSTGFISCKKENGISAIKTDALSLENATVIMAGDLSSSSEENTGVANIYRQTNGKYVLGLEHMTLNDNTSLIIYLASSKTGSSSSIEIFSAINLYGNVFHILPNNIDFTVFKYLIIQAEHSEEIVASAELS
jgi:hypothetical protein